MLKQDDRKNDVFRLYYWHGATLVGKYRLPQLRPTQFIPHDVIGFNERNSVSHPERYWLDFFIDDYQFESFWNHADSTLSSLYKFAGIVTPDFSMLPDMLPGQIIWNNTRNRIMAYYLQEHKINIVPTASWSSEDDFEWCFDGLPEGSSIAVSTNGCKSDPYSQRIFLQGVQELYRQKKPSHLIVCGREMEELVQFNNVVYYPCFSQRWKGRNNNGK